MQIEDIKISELGSIAEDARKEFLDRRMLILNKDIDEDVIETVVMQIYKFNDEDSMREELEKNYNREDNPIQIYINTYGGLTYEMLSIISAIESSKTPVYTIGLGKIMSAGFGILVAGHSRACQKYSTLMWHQGSTMVSGKFMDIKEGHEENERLQAVVDEILISKTKLTKKHLDDIYNNRSDKYFSAEQALKMGIVDIII